MFYSHGHSENMRDGYAYDFQAGPEYFHADGSGQRATLKQFQTYPQNSVQGGGQLVMGVCENGFLMPGSAFRETQPAQVLQTLVPIQADILAGGIDYNGYGWQPLVSSTEG